MSELGPPQLNNDATFGLPAPGVPSFHRALQAALHTGVALDLGRVAITKSARAAVPSGRLTLRKLQTLQSLTQRPSSDRPSQAVQPLSPTELLASAFGELVDALPQKYVAGFSVYVVTGRTDLVLDAMSVDLRAERELARVARPSLAYLAALAFIGGVLGTGSLAITLLMIDKLNKDLLLGPHPVAVPRDVAPWITESQFYMLPWIALVILLVALASLLPRVSAGIAKCLGGFGYLVSQRRAMAARVEHALVLSGIEGTEAEQTATKLVGFQYKRKQAIRTVSRNDQSPSDLQRLSLDAKHYHARSNTRLRQLRFGLPLLLVLTVGSAGVLLYSLALFVPLTHLMYDLAAPVVDPVTGWNKQ